MKARPFWMYVHRYVGLAMTVFLIIVGLTGSLLAFYEDLDGLMNPGFYTEPEGRHLLTLPALLDAAKEAAGTEMTIKSIWLSDSIAQVSVAPKDIDQAEPSYDQLLLNPYTGMETGRRHWGVISDGLTNLFPFIYKLHYNLALDDIGMWILGITALIWTLDCFVGLYLTFPASVVKSNPDATGSRFLSRWQKSWTVKWRGSAFRINYDLHRAGGLWLWLLLLIFAWSSVYMNLSDSVYQKVMQSVSDYHQPWTDIKDLPEPIENPAIDLEKAYQIGIKAMAEAAVAHGFTVEKQVGLWLNAAKGFYVYCVRSSADIQDAGGLTRVVIDATTGQTLMMLLPTGQYNGNTITTWLAALHMANIFGMPYRVLVCLTGLVIVMLSVTGMVIWLKKRRQSRVSVESEKPSDLHYANKPELF